MVFKVLQGRKSSQEENAQKELFEHYLKSPIPEHEVLSNLGLFLARPQMRRILFFHELYLKILPIQGSVMEFGARWGQNLCLFASFRGIHEPFNAHRKIIGFDTFEGFVNISNKDGNSRIMERGALSVTKEYDKYLADLLELHEKMSPISHLRKFEIIKGDASEKLEEYLKGNPETMIALAYFDMDLYEPTKKCLELIRPHLTKGSVIGFDELNHHDYPGETMALKEVIGLDRYRIERSIYSASQSYVVIE
jgi:hypothetical protein